jgi:predicted Zn-dependent protease
VTDRNELVAAVDAARAGGARAAEVLRVRAASLAQGGARGKSDEEVTVTYTARAWRDGGRAGTGCGTSANEAVVRALAASGKAKPDPLAGPAERAVFSGASLGIDDRRHATITGEDRADVLGTAERALAQGGVVHAGVKYGQRREERAWLSTRGTEGAYASTRYDLRCKAKVAGAELVHHIASRHFSDIASLPFGQELRKRVESLGTAVTLPAGPLPVVLEPRVLADLVRDLAPHFAAERVAAGNFMSGRVGAAIGWSGLSLVDDPALPSGLFSHPFDERGVSPVRVTLVDDGVVRGLLHSPESARAAEARATGHTCCGETRPSNLVVRAGNRTRNMILAEHPAYLVPDRLPGIDRKTGRLRGEIPLVLGQASQRLGATKVKIDWHVADLLGALVELASDEERHVGVDAPTALVVGLQVSR